MAGIPFQPITPVDERQAQIQMAVAAQNTAHTLGQIRHELHGILTQLQAIVQAVARIR